MTSPQDAFRISGQNRDSQIVITCDHASNHIPPEVFAGNLGLPAIEMDRHIAYDVGAAGVAEQLGRLLNAPVICSTFSRLVIDPNRGEDDPTLVMKIYDGTIIPGNRHLSDDDLTWRLDHCYRPYHAAVARLLAGRTAPVMIAIHSFTPKLAGRRPRPWHLGILYEKDQRLARPMLAILSSQHDLCIGENEPYGGHLDGDSIDRHALAHGHPNLLIEIRNDLIRTEIQQLNWAERLAPILAEVIAKTPITRG
ncbi:MAG: N-formylglutamate amidohydrolase [Rhodobacteraceae bacterium]|nr:N-formylglutamate amidohydrolase [Paracoccaceae bacterium]